MNQGYQEILLYFCLVLSGFYFISIKYLIHLEFNLVKSMNPTFFLTWLPEFFGLTSFFTEWFIFTKFEMMSFVISYVCVHTYLHLFLDFVVCSGGLSDYSHASTFTFQALLYVLIHDWVRLLSLHFFFKSFDFFF